MITHKMFNSDVMEGENIDNFSFSDEFILPRLDEMCKEDFSCLFLSNLSNSLGPHRSTDCDQEIENFSPVPLNQNLCESPEYFEITKYKEASGNMINEDPPNFTDLKKFEKKNIFKVFCPFKSV